MSHFLASAASLFGMAVLCRLLLGQRQEVDSWDLRLEIPRTIGLGLTFAVRSAWWLSSVHAGIEAQIAYFFARVATQQ